MRTNDIGHRSCPFCGVWMVVRKADRKDAANDTFECALCGTVIHVPGEGEKAGSAHAEPVHGPRA
jgi:hypothetical protein